MAKHEAKSTIFSRMQCPQTKQKQRHKNKTKKTKNKAAHSSSLSIWGNEAKIGHNSHQLSAEQNPGQHKRLLVCLFVCLFVFTIFPFNFPHGHSLHRIQRTKAFGLVWLAFLL